MIVIAPAPITVLRSESEASHLIINGSTVPKAAHLIDDVEVMSKEQLHLSLGNFTSTTQPEGFLVRVDPADTSHDAIATQITSLGTDDQHELVLHIANDEDKTVEVEVWQL